MFSNLSYQYYDIPAKLAHQRENQMGNRMTPKHILITILCIRLNKRCVIHMFTMCFVGKGASEKVFRLIKAKASTFIIHINVPVSNYEIKYAV